MHRLLLLLLLSPPPVCAQATPAQALAEPVVSMPAAPRSEPFDYNGRNNDALAGSLAGGLIGVVLGAAIGAGIGMAEHAYDFTTMGAVGIGALVGFAVGAPFGSALGAAWRSRSDRFGERVAAGMEISYGLVALAVIIALAPALSDPAPLANAFLTTAPAAIAAFLTPLVAPLPQLAF